MKRTQFVYLLSMVLLLAAGCRQMEEVEPEVTGSRILKAILESDPDTRTHLSGQDSQGIYYPYWSDDEELAVYIDGIEVPDRYSLVDGSGSVSGVFSGTVTGLEKVALYPYSDRVPEGLQGNVLNLDLPSVQPYREGSFGEGIYPMIAVGNSDELRFRNLCSVLKVSMTGGEIVRSVKFVAHDSLMPVCGRATVRTDYSFEPELEMSDGGANYVTLECGYVPLSSSKATDFFIVIPPGTYRGGFSVEIETFGGTVTRSTDADIEFKRSQIRSIPAFECVSDGEIDIDDIPYNEIWYWTSSNRVHTPRGSFDKEIISNTYSDGKGVIVFDGPVTQVGGYTFCVSDISRVVLPNTVESIGGDAFCGSSIVSFHTPDRLKSVGNYAFDCDKLSRFYGKYASSDEKALVLEDGTLVAYAHGAVQADLTIPDGVKSLASYVFDDCSIIETVTFPSSVENIAYGCFSDCVHLREFKGDNVHIPDGHAFVNPKGELVAWAGFGLTDYIIPDEVTYFAEVFRDSSTKTLHSLTFPYFSFRGAVLMDYFRGFDNLEFFYGPNTTDDHKCLIVSRHLLAVTKVLPSDYSIPEGYDIAWANAYLFSENKTVERLSLPDNIPEIYKKAFSNMSKLRSLRLPANLTSLGSDAFAGTGTLDTLYLRSFTPPSYSESDSGFIGHKGLVICVPKGLEDLYKTAPTWSKYADYIQGYVYDDLQNTGFYISTDYSRDGSVTRLQKASEGAGIDLVLMGDGFTDIQIADGTYAAVMGKMADAFFSVEPYATLKSLFNVYSVDVVSATEGYDHPGQALNGWFGDDTRVGGSDSKCIDYARAAVRDDRMDNALIIVAMNSPKYAGTCYMYNPSRGDYGSGVSVAYFPIGTSDEMLAQLVHHEAGGHGFSKLDDEYSYESMGIIPQEEIQHKRELAAYGWWKNVDFTDDPSKVKWARFLTDERYQYDGLGLFEGACTYWRGAWRPTENSIMRHNTGGYNAPSRESIWYRAHKLAYGESWQYDYEEFVRYDEKNRKTSASASVTHRANYVENRMPPLHPPVVVPIRWNEAAVMDK